MNASTVSVWAVLAICALMCPVHSLSGGAPTEACVTLSPLPAAHGATPQAGTVPYAVDLSALDDGSGAFSYMPGDTYELTVQGISPALNFRGVLLQGRSMADDSAVGTFEATDPLTRISSCTPNDISVTHDTAVDKQSITTMWTAPAEGTGPVQIGFAVVMTQTVYWANQRTAAIAERATAEPTTEAATTIPDVATTADSPMGLGGDPHFSIKLPSGKQLCYSVQGEQGFTFNLISNRFLHMNALFMADAEREEVTWIGGLGMVIENAQYKDSKVTTLRFDATKKSVHIGSDVTLEAQSIDTITIKDGKLSISTVNRGFNCSCFPVQVELQDIGLNFSVHFVKNNHIDMKWDGVEYLSSDSHGIIGQFFRKGVEIDETRHLLLLPGMSDPVPVMRKPIWHFMEREKAQQEGHLCWVAMNPGYQGKRLIEGSYLDYVVDDLLSLESKN